MKLFTLNDTKTVACEHEDTRSGFRHIAILMHNGSEIDRTKVCYSNRTWESYEFQTVLSKLLDNNPELFPDEESKKEWLQKGGTEAKEEAEAYSKTVGAIASLGEIFCDTPKEKNDWKLRMIKAGFENTGLTIPEDWDTLSEEEKESRLNKVIEFSKGVQK